MVAFLWNERLNQVAKDAFFFINFTGKVRFCSMCLCVANFKPFRLCLCTFEELKCSTSIFCLCSFQEGRQMIYLPLLLVNELSSRVKDLKVGRPFLCDIRHCLRGLSNLASPAQTGDRQQQCAAPPHNFLWGNLSEEISLLDPFTRHRLLPATVRWEYEGWNGSFLRVWGFCAWEFLQTLCA